MKYLSVLLYLIVFYISICLFFFYFNEFSFTEKVIMATLISGFHCISSLISILSEV